MSKKQVIRLNESQLRQIIKKSVKMMVNEQYGVDFEDTLTWVKKKNPYMSHKEASKFARNIINKKRREYIGTLKAKGEKPQFKSISEVCSYYGYPNLKFKQTSDVYDDGERRHIWIMHIPEKLWDSKDFNEFEKDIHSLFNSGKMRYYGEILEDGDFDYDINVYTHSIVINLDNNM